ncbi:MAG: hypothetical protein E7096_02360 [Bacteroides sp.]|nr:hypothetical protein [Bacteroides sp.]
MKDITITAQRQKIELCTLLACFVIANLVNLYAILSHDAPLSEMYTSLGYILVLTAVVYALWTILRIIYYGTKKLILRK